MEGNARIWFTPKQKVELWERWKSGQCVADIARALERRNKSGVYQVSALNGEIVPTAVTWMVADDPRMVAGKAIYEDRCAACHIYSGAGIPTLFLRLASAPLVQSIDSTSLIRDVLIGSRAVATSATPTAPAMPAFGWNLNDTEIADVLTYVRNTWGNAASAVQPEDVSKLRGRLQQ